MSKLNKKAPTEKILTHEGAPAKRINSVAMLRRSVMSCLLWENEFYEDGQTIADRICSLVNKCDLREASSIALEARSNANLRHVPLLITAAMAKRVSEMPTHDETTSAIVQNTAMGVIQRADEIAELIAVVAKINGVEPNAVKKKLSHPLRRGIAHAFDHFNEYAFAKYNRDGAIKLRDALFMCHPKPSSPAKAELFKKIASNTLETPDTWEVELSAGKDKKETFERLIREGKLGYLALLRNLRNMIQADCDHKLVHDAIISGVNSRVLPFRFIAAARAAPQFEAALDKALLTRISTSPQIKGVTAILVDTSVSMNHKLSGKSDLTRVDAACALASIFHGEYTRVFSFSDKVVEVPPRKGMAGIDAIRQSQVRSGTRLGQAVLFINDHVKCDRLIVITDEQSQDRVPDPKPERSYMINVASARNGVGYGKWIHIDGFSENVLRFIAEVEG